jgi:hypothetical protein
VGIDRKANTQAIGAPQRGHGAPLKPLTQLGDALRVVGAIAVYIDTTELVVVQAVKVGVWGGES